MRCALRGGGAINKSSIAMRTEAKIQKDVMEQNKKDPADLSCPTSVKN